MSFASRLQNFRVNTAPPRLVSSAVGLARANIPGFNDASSTVVASRSRVASGVAQSTQQLGASEFQVERPPESTAPVAPKKKAQVSSATGKSFIKYNGDIDLLDLKIKRLSNVRELYASGLVQPQDVNIIPEKKDVLPAGKKKSISKTSVESAQVSAPTAAISAVSELAGITSGPNDGFKNVLYDGAGLAQGQKNIVVNEEEKAMNDVGVSLTGGEVAEAVTSNSGASSGLVNALAPGGAQVVSTQLEKSAATPADAPPEERPSALFRRSNRAVARK